MNDTIELNKRLEKLLPLVRQASSLALSHFGRVSGHTKSDGSIVTEADSLTETLLVEGLKASFPDETIMGEELGLNIGDPRFVWSIDPIDGTAAYASRLPFWCVSVGLMVDRRPVLGVVSLPVLDEIYYAYEGGGAYMESSIWGKERLRLPDKVNLEGLTKNSMICVPSDFHREFACDFKGKARSLGSTAIHTLLATRHDAIATLVCAYQWDIAGALPILFEAGGVIEEYASGQSVDVQSLLPGKVPPYVMMGHPQYLSYIREHLRYRGK